MLCMPEGTMSPPLPLFSPPSHSPASSRCPARPSAPSPPPCTAPSPAAGPGCGCNTRWDHQRAPSHKSWDMGSSSTQTPVPTHALDSAPSLPPLSLCTRGCSRSAVRGGKGTVLGWRGAAGLRAVSEHPGLSLHPPCCSPARRLEKERNKRREQRATHPHAQSWISQLQSPPGSTALFPGALKVKAGKAEGSVLPSLKVRRANISPYTCGLLQGQHQHRSLQGQKPADFAATGPKTSSLLSKPEPGGSCSGWFEGTTTTPQAGWPRPFPRHCPHLGLPVGRMAVELLSSS